MKKNFRLNVLLISLLFLLGVAKVDAQKREFTNVRKISMNGVQEIKKNDVVIGYYAYFFVEKKDRKNYTFQLDIMDTKLKTTHKVTFTKPKRSVLLEMKFNGSHFCFTYLDVKKRSLTSTLYDLSGKKTGTNVVDDLDRRSVGVLRQQLEMEDGYYSGTLVPIDKKGFAIVYPKKQKGLKAKIDMFDNKGKKLWTADSGSTSKTWEMFAPMYSSGDYLVGTINSRPGMMSKKMTETVYIFDVKNGHVKGKAKTKTPKAYYVVNGVDFDKEKNEFFMFGSKYGMKGKKVNYKTSLGVFVKYFKPDGKTTDKYMAYWGKDIMKKVKGKDKSKIKKGASIMLHNMVRTNTGKFVAVGELYNKEASALGIASKMLGGGNSEMSVAKIVLYNLLVMEFDKDFRTTKVTVVEKPKQNRLLPSGAVVVNEGALGYYLKSYGLFDFEFFSTNSDHSSFNTVYTSYNRGKKGRNGNRYTIGVISMDDEGEVVFKKISLNSKPTLFSVLPSKPGYIGIFEYFWKGKKADIRIEKLDL